jgi:carbamoyl-phosphate synthase large subunit
MRFPRKGVLLSLGPVADKYWFADETRIIANELQLPIYATRGTAEMLAEIGIPCTVVEKISGSGVSGLDVIEQGHVDFVINVARDYDQFGRPDGYWIRRHAVDLGVPLVTDLQLARAIIEALRWKKPSSLEVRAWNDYVGRSPLSSNATGT